MIALGGGALVSERVRAALRRHRAVLLDVDVDTAWQRAGRPRAAAGPRPRALRRRCTPSARPLYERWPTSCCPARRAAPRCGTRCPTLARARRRARRAPGCCGRTSASGDYPVYVGRRAAGLGLLAPLARAPPRRSASPTRPSRDLLRAGARRPRDRPAPSRPARSSKTLARGRARCCARSPRRGMTRDDHVVALGGGVVGDLAGFCAATYQRGVAGRAGADHARRPGRLRLRRQDRRRPARGQELRRRLPPAGGGARRSGGARARCPTAELRGGLGRGASRPR